MGDAHQISRRRFLRSAGLLALVGPTVSLLGACGDPAPSDDSSTAAADATTRRREHAVTLYREEGCSCCVTYADYLRDNGFAVDVKTVSDLGPIRTRYAVPEAGVGCHTSVVGEYVVEGHVPMEAIERLLAERPAFDGISVIGMPANSPGMGRPNGQPLDVLSMRAGQVAPYMSVTTF